jgi:hypothetical protein
VFSGNTWPVLSQIGPFYADDPLQAENRPIRQIFVAGETP